MKIKRSLALASVLFGLWGFALPANGQSNRHGGGNSNRGDIQRNNGRHGDFRFHRGGSRVNFFFGGAFGYPFYGYPFSGYPYYGYAPYGYGYPVGAYSTYDPRHIYQGQVVNRGRGGSNSVAVQVQQQLAAGGYYEGEIDGVVGEGTRRAIRNYERDNNLRVHGRIDDQLLAAMGLG